MLIPWETLDFSVEMKNPIEFEHFLAPLISDENVMRNFEYSNFSRSLMVLAPQDKPTVDYAMGLLNKIEKLLKECEKHRDKNNFLGFETCMQKAVDLNSEYLEVIPKVNPAQIETLLYPYQVQNERKILKSLYSISYSVRCVLGAYLNQKKVNPYDYILGTLNVKMGIVDSNSEEFNLILHYLNSDIIHGFNLRNIIKMENIEYNEKDDKKFNETPNHMMLWHGTSAYNLLNIVKEGLKIVPAEGVEHGSRFGRGLYFSDAFALSS